MLHCMRYFGLFLLPLALLTASPAASDVELQREFETFLDDFVSLSNQRDLQGLLDLYTAAPRMVKKGKELEPDIRTLLAEQFEAWDRYDVEFAIEELQTVTRTDDTAVVEFIISGKGKVFLFTMRREFSKQLSLRQEDGDWRIFEDVTF